MIELTYHITTNRDTNVGVGASLYDTDRREPVDFTCPASATSTPGPCMPTGTTP